MKVILLENIKRIGSIGEIIDVKRGFARNFLIANKKEFFVKKLSTENKELYGSVKPTEISKLIKDKETLDITPSMIQPIKEIKSLGKFKVKVSLHSEIDAEIHVLVESAETIQ